MQAKPGMWFQQPQLPRTQARAKLPDTCPTATRSQSAPQHFARSQRRLADFMGAVRDLAVLAECVGVSKEVMAGEYYRALMRCRKLMAYENQKLGLANVDPSLPARGHAG